MLDELVLELTKLAQACRYAIWSKVRPDGFGKRSQISEEETGMGKRFTYSQELLPVTKPGVVKQRLRVFINGVLTEEQPLDPSVLTCQFQAGPEGAECRLALDYLDEHDNDSLDAEDTFIVQDKIGPEAPAGFGVRLQIAEEEIPDEPVV